METHVHGGDVYRYQNVIDFSSNCNPFGTPKGVKDAICQAAAEIRQYPDVHCTRLRTALVEKLDLPGEWMFFGNGAADVIFALALALKPKKALLPAPTFAEYEQALKTVDCWIERYLTGEAEGFRLQEEFIQSIEEDTDVVFLCNPNNPTGTLADRAFLERVLNRCRETKTMVVVDECFLDFVEAPGEYTLLGMLEDCENLMILKAFTKLYAMAGVRLGYGLTSNRQLLDRMEAATQPWNVSHLAQAAGVAALKETEYVEESLSYLRGERRWLLQAMQAAGYKTYDSAANYVFFRGPKGLWQRCLDEGILIRDCSNYPGLGEGYYRVCVGRHEENLNLMNVLCKVRENNG